MFLVGAGPSANPIFVVRPFARPIFGHLRTPPRKGRRPFRRPHSSISPEATLDKATLPDFLILFRADHPHVLHFHLRGALQQCSSLSFPVFFGESLFSPSGSVRIENPCLFGGFPCHLPKKTRKGRTGLRYLPDTKLVLTKNDSETIIFQKLRISRVIP